MTTWVKRMSVTGSQGDTYTVGMSEAGWWGCSCPAWKFHRAPKPDCKHITAVKAGLARRGVKARVPVMVAEAESIRRRATAIIAEVMAEQAQPATDSRAISLDFEIGEIRKIAAIQFAELDYQITVE